VTALHLRDYQREAIDAVFQSWYDGMKRPAIVLPTGAGKTVVFAHLIRQFIETHDPNPENMDAFQTGSRVIVLVHRDELADQAIAKIKAVAPDLSVGKVKAESDDTDADVMVCSVQTLAVERRRNRLAWHEAKHGQVGLIITDECHHAAAASYGKVYDAFPDALQLGVTATLARGDRVGLGSVWEEVVYSKSVLWMISKGYLSDVKAKRIDLEGLDLAGIKTSSGDYQAGALGEAMEAAGADKVIAAVYKEHAGDRQGVVFTPTVETAHSTMVALEQAGIPSAYITGETPRDIRRKIFEEFRKGQTQVLVNCMVLTEGFDAPWASCAVIARPTQSQPLYTQMVGRVLRTWPGKEDALVLDVVGASSNKLKTLIDLEPGVVKSLMPDELLAEAVVREAEAENKVVPAGSIAFSLKHKDVNMFAASSQAWLRTGKGVLFIDCGDTMVFLWPDSGTWAVCTISREDYRWKTPQWTEYRGLALSEAMAWGEAVSEDHSSFGTTKAAAWRKKKPSEKLSAYARRLGINVLETAKAGEVSDKISVVMASRVFDAHA
jgi:superfamily II DNA or RNA helicase